VLETYNWLLLLKPDIGNSKLVTGLKPSIENLRLVTGLNLGNGNLKLGTGLILGIHWVKTRHWVNTGYSLG